MSRLDVDWELWQVLDLCTDEELETCERAAHLQCTRYTSNAPCIITVHAADQLY